MPTRCPTIDGLGTGDRSEVPRFQAAGNIFLRCQFPNWVH